MACLQSETARPCCRPGHAKRRFVRTCLFLLLLLAARLTVEGASTVDLTAEERAWLAEHPTVRFGCDPDWPPFSFRQADGALVGIDMDLLQLLSERIGLKFEPVPTRNWEEAYARIKRGELDLVTGTARTPERQRYLHFSSAYLSFPVAIISRTDDAFYISVEDLPERRLAGPSNHAPIMELRRQFPELRLVETPTEDAAFEAVLKKRADVAVTNLANASFIIKTRGLTGLKIAGILPQQFDLTLAVPQDRTVLLHILDKGLDTLTRADLQTLNHRWIRVDYSRLIRWEIVRRWLLIGGAAVLALLGFFGWHAWTLRVELAKRRVVQQALEAANARLNVANAEITARHGEVSELMRVAGHDLRTPLTSVQLATDVLAFELEPKWRPHLDRIKTSARQMTGLIDDLLAVHALEEGRRVFQPAETDTTGLLRETLEALAPVAQRKRIVLDDAGVQALPPLVVDPGALRQVFDNLISNALKYSPPDRTVRVRSLLWNNQVRVEVRDRGPGVPESEREKVFTKYFRGTAKPTAGEKSTGLGLAIVRELVAAMNGRVWCENAPEGGAVFIVVVPLPAPAR